MEKKDYIDLLEAVIDSKDGRAKKASKQILEAAEPKIEKIIEEWDAKAEKAAISNKAFKGVVANKAAYVPSPRSSNKTLRQVHLDLVNKKG